MESHHDYGPIFRQSKMLSRERHLHLIEISFALVVPLDRFFIEIYLKEVDDV